MKYVSMIFSLYPFSSGNQVFPTWKGKYRKKSCLSLAFHLDMDFVKRSKKEMEENTHTDTHTKYSKSMSLFVETSGAFSCLDTILRE